MKRLAATLLLLGAVACTSAKPPVVTPAPPPMPDRYVRFTVRGSDGHIPLGTTVYIYTDHPIRMDCETVGDRANCKLDPRVPVGDSEHGIGGHVIVEAHGYYQFSAIFLMTGVLNQELEDIRLVPTFRPLPRLQIAGKFFRLDTGERWTAIEASDFNLYTRFLKGEDIEPILAQRAEAGFNLLRVFTAFDICSTGGGCQIIGRLVPRERVDYYTLLPYFLMQCARHGLRVELVAFTGPYTGVFANADEMVAHWNNLVAVAMQPDNTNVLLELINEFDNPPNAGVPLELMQRPPLAVLASHGSAVQDALPLQPVWSYATYHPASGPEWARKAAHNGMEDVADPFGVPVLVNETIRFPDNEASSTQACDAAEGAALLEAGAAFHSIHGKSSELWVGAERDAAYAWASCAQRVPLEYQAGAYLRFDPTPGYIRIYARRLPDGREYVVRLHQP